MEIHILVMNLILNIVKMLVLSKLFYKLNSISRTILVGFFLVEINKVLLIFT